MTLLFRLRKLLIITCNPHADVEIHFRGLQEEVIGPKENSSPQPDLEEFTYKE
jgi:hypothetical protein